MSGFAIKVDLSAFEAAMDADAKVCEEAARPAAQAGAQVLYDAVRANVSRIKRYTGNLASSIYQAYSKENSSQGLATYHVSWNHKKAPHGHLLEWGHLDRYVQYRDARGRFFPMVRPGMEGKPKPGRRASRAEKDAYYVTRDVPIQVPARAFVRRAIDQMPRAEAAMRERFLAELAARKVIR